MIYWIKWQTRADAPGICVWFYLFLKFRILHAANRIPIYFDPLHSRAPSVNLDLCIFRRLSSSIISKFSGAIKPPRFFMASQSFSANFSQKLYIILTIFSIPTLWISIVFQKKLCYNPSLPLADAKWSLLRLHFFSICAICSVFMRSLEF